MSKNRRNFHYHYAEQYETRADRRRARARHRARYAVAPVAIIPALVLLVILGLTSTAFSSYVQSPDSIVSEAARTSSALAQLKDTVNSFDSANRKADLAPSGAQAELSDTSAQSGLADTGANSDLADSAANVDIADTASTYPGGMKLYIKPSSNWKEASAKFKIHVWDDSDHSALSDPATQCSFDSDYYVAEVPSGYTWTHYQWARRNPSTDAEWGWSRQTDGGECNAYWNSGWESDGGFYNILVPGDTFYFDDSQCTSWETTASGTVIYCNKNDGAKNTVHQIAQYLYSYTIPANTIWDDKDVYFWRGNSSTLWNNANPIPRGKYNFGIKNAVSVSAISNGNGTTGLLSLTGLSTPTITGNHEFKSDESFTVSLTDTPVLNYTFDGVARTTGLLNPTYTFTLDGTTIQTGSATSYTFAADYFDNNYGTHTVTVTVSSADSGMPDVTSAVTTLTVMNPNTCEIQVDNNSTKTISSMAVNEIQSVTITALAPHTTENITVTGIPGYLAVATASGDFTTSSINVQSGATVRIKALAPKATASTIRVECAVGHTNSIHAEIVVSAIATPTIAYPANSYELFYDSSVSVGSVTYSPASELASPVSYALVTTDTGSDTASSLASTDGTDITGAGTSVNSNTTHYLKITIGFNTSYSVTEYKPVTIKPRPECHIRGLGISWSNTNDNKMDYSSTRPGVYTKEFFLQGNQHKYENDTGFLISYDNAIYSDGYWFHDTFTSASGLTKYTGGSGWSNMTLTTSDYGGNYLFTFDTNTNTISITFPTSATYYLISDSDQNWRIGNHPITNNDTHTVNLAARTGSYTFKVFCTYKDRYFGGSSISYSNRNNAVSFNTSGGNCTLSAWYSGNYTLSFTNLTTSGCTVQVTSSPDRTVHQYNYITGTENEAPAMVNGVQQRRQVTVTDNHNDTWTVSCPPELAGDIYKIDSWASQLTTAQSGWSVTVGNASTSNGTVTATITLNAPTPAAPNSIELDIIHYWGGITYSIVSSENGYDPTAYVLGSSNSNSITVNLDAGDNFQFKVYCNTGKYFGYNTAIAWDGNEDAWDDTEGSVYNFTEKVNNNTTTNCSLTAWYSGEYTFNFSNLDPVDGCTVTLSSTPTRTVTNIDYFDGTTNEVPTGHRKTVSLTDNHDDTWTISVENPAENDYYKFVGWSNAVTGVSTSNNVTTGTITTSPSNATVNVISYWQNKTYTITMYTKGASIPAAPTGTTDLQAHDSGDDKYYTCTYTYGTPVTLPSVFVKNDTWTFGGWYETSDTTFSATSPTTGLTNSDYGSKSFTAKWTMTVTFTDNIGGDTFNSQTVVWGGSVTAPTTEQLPTYDGFTTGSSLEYWNSNNDTSLTGIKTGKTIYVIYKPITEATEKIYGDFLPNEKAPMDGDIFNVYFGASIDSQFYVNSAYNDPNKYSYNIKYYYTISVNNVPQSFTVNNNTVTEATMTPADSVVNNIRKHSSETVDIATLMTRPNSAINSNGTVVIHVKTYYVDNRGTTVYSASDFERTITVQYQVNTPFQRLDVTPVQRIYSSSTAPAMTAVFNSDIDFTNSDYSGLYAARLYNDRTSAQIGSDVALTTGSQAGEYTASFNSLISTDFQSQGVKYYRIKFFERESTSASFVEDTFINQTVHTTVGTSESGGSRPLFLKLSGSGFGNVMMFYANNSALTLQTSESFSRSGQSETIYRFNIPSAVTNVTFAVTSGNSAVKYFVPTASGSTVSFGSDVGSDKYYLATASVDVTGKNSVEASYANDALSCTAVDLR